MADAGENITPIDPQRRLADAIRDVKNAAADREDVVVELREASRMRLELLAQELAPVFAEVPTDTDMFDFAVSSGLQPRLWIDAISHVGLGRDRRTYRFLKDTRIGRVVLAESTDMKPVAEQVTRYIAERIVERQRLMDGGISHSYAGTKAVPEAAAALEAPRASGWQNVFAAFGLFAAGAVVGFALTMAWLRVGLSALMSGF